MKLRPLPSWYRGMVWVLSSCGGFWEGVVPSLVHTGNYPISDTTPGGFLPTANSDPGGLLQVPVEYPGNAIYEGMGRWKLVAFHSSQKCGPWGYPFLEYSVAWDADHRLCEWE